MLNAVLTLTGSEFCSYRVVLESPAHFHQPSLRSTRNRVPSLITKKSGSAELQREHLRRMHDLSSLLCYAHLLPLTLGFQVDQKIDKQARRDRKNQIQVLAVQADDAVAVLAVAVILPRCLHRKWYLKPSMRETLASAHLHMRAL